MLALLPTVFSLFAVAAPPTITPAEAAQHVGHEVVVQGKVEQIVTALSLTTHINFGGRYPNQVFTGKIFKPSQGLFVGGVKMYEGKVAEVQGVVRMYKGKPEIEITRPSQLRLAGGAAAPAPGTPGQPGDAVASSITEPTFDARGADFAPWVVHFKTTVAQQWRIPEGPSRGQVDFEFVVERDGTMSSIRMLESSGTASLDRAAANALEHSRFLPLPETSPAQNVMMRVSFVYGGGAK